MKKKNLADKIAEKAFKNSKVQESWDNLLKVFGPILEPAFADDPKSRIHLGNALNSISRGELQKAIKLLESIKDNCVTEEDIACHLFCMGLVFDMAGEKDLMLQYYNSSCEYNHDFYMPYLKIAKSAHSDGAYDVAEDYYKRALYCFDASDTMNDETNIPIIASVYANLASTLIMMQRFEEAEDFLMLSVQTLAVQPGRSGTFAILYAATGREDEADKALRDLENEAPQLVESVRKVVKETLEEKNPQFSEIHISSESLDSFWSWFAENETSLVNRLEDEEYEDVFSELGNKVSETFPFMERTPEFGFGKDDEIMGIVFVDFYSVALRCGYEKLIASCPEALKERWIFSIDR